jgi:hypothetical protein
MPPGLPQVPDRLATRAARPATRAGRACHTCGTGLPHVPPGLPHVRDDLPQVSDGPPASEEPASHECPRPRDRRDAVAGVREEGAGVGRAVACQAGAPANPAVSPANHDWIRDFPSSLSPATRAPTRRRDGSPA